jgi:Fic family protein
MEATFVPPPVEQMHGALDVFEKYLHADSEYPPLIRMSFIHYQFEAIHPFLDGNGRIGRLLIPLLLCEGGILPQPLLYLSAFFDRQRDPYYHLLLEVSREGRWNDWVVFFLKAVETQARDAIRRSERLLSLWRDYRARMQRARASSLLLRIVDELFAYPALTNSGISQRLSITARSTQLNIDKLVAAGVLREATGRRRNRVYFASEIAEIIEEQEPDL